MVSFAEYKFDAEQWLAFATDKMTASHKRALSIIVELAERGQELEKENERLCSENADLRLKVEELEALCNRKARQCCHKDKIISSLDLENAALKRELAGEMEKY